MPPPVLFFRMHMAILKLMSFVSWFPLTSSRPGVEYPVTRALAVPVTVQGYRMVEGNMASREAQIEHALATHAVDVEGGGDAMV